MNRVASGLAALVAAGVAVAGCGSSSSGGGGSQNATPNQSAAAAAIAGCTPQTLQTVSPGTLTIGVDQPVYPPWFNDNKDPINGNGYESAVDLAIAKKLGYTPDQIKVKRVSFTQAIGPAARGFDFDLDEFSITKKRAQAVDFSAPYYDVAEAVVAMKGSKGASVTTLAELRTLKLGAQTGSTNQQTISAVIKPAQHAFFGTNALAVQALKNGQIDGLVVDLPTAFYITAAQIKNSVIVGQLPSTGTPEQFGALLAKDSPLTSCVTKAVEALKSDGTLASIEAKWLAKEANAPVLQ
ncbi:MAG TPA: ABC transporter substrate-binding protein [Mycobacteriales bacterium]|nr:ABC transporter substrate-binding protein [Mycobacteriales bacterium]